MYKAKNKICPTLFQELFPTYENSCNLRNNISWQTINVRTEGLGTETLLFIAQKNCERLPGTIKISESLTSFKHQLKNGLQYGAHATSVKHI